MGIKEEDWVKVAFGLDPREEMRKKKKMNESLQEGGPGSGKHHNKPGRRGSAKGKVAIFHGTVDLFIDKIMEEGLKPVPLVQRLYADDAIGKSHEDSYFYKGERINSVFLTKKKDLAEYWGLRAAVGQSAEVVAIVEMEVPEEIASQIKEDEMAPGSYRYVGSIPKEFIKKVTFIRVGRWVKGKGFERLPESEWERWEQKIHESVSEKEIFYTSVIIKNEENMVV